MTKDQFLKYIKVERQFKYNWTNELGTKMPERIITIKPTGTDSYLLNISNWYDEAKFETKSVHDTYLDTYVMSTDYDNYGVISEPRFHFSQLQVIFTTEEKDEKIAKLERLISNPMLSEEQVTLFRSGIEKLKNM
jgi:hypothetical protein